MTEDQATQDVWLAGLQPDRTATIAGVRDLVNAALPDGYVERVAGSMLVWEVPLSRYPDTYNKQPLMLAALAAQKNHNALYLICAYADAARDARLRDAYARAGRRSTWARAACAFASARRCWMRPCRRSSPRRRSKR